MDKVNPEGGKKHAGGRPAGKNEARQHIGQVIRRYRLAAGMDQAEVAERLGCTKNAIGGWETGRNGPALDVIPKLCQTLGIPIHELMGMEPDRNSALTREEKQLLARYNQLSQPHQKAVSELMESLCIEQDRVIAQALSHFTVELPYTDLLCPAAGPGITAPDYAEPETLCLRAGRTASRSDLIMKINGDSMEPEYPDGCMVFVNTREETPLGETGIFIVDGEYFIKVRHSECLYSLNRAHADITFYDGMEIRHYGRVLGIVREEDILTNEALNQILESCLTDEHS